MGSEASMWGEWEGGAEHKHIVLGRKTLVVIDF